MKRFLAVFLMLAILLAGLTVTASAATTGWVKDGDNWTYVKADGKLATNEWIKDGGKWYYFMGTTMVSDGVYMIKETWYAFEKSGAMVANGWYEQKGVYDGGTWSDWYYAGVDGALVTGWKKIDKIWYYFAPLTGTWTDEETGETETWKQAPYMYSAGMWKIDNKYYAFKKSGEMIIGWGQPWITYKYDDGTPDTAWVYANADGSLTGGWKQIDGKWYYFWETWPSMLRDGVVPFVNGKPDWESDNPTIYAFRKSGEMVENGWYEEKWFWYDEDNTKHDGSSWYYLGKDGAAKKGWIKDNGKWYYLDPDWCFMWSDWMGEMSDGNTYALKKNGEMVVGWYQVDSDWYFFKDSGAMAKKAWQQSSGKWYYLKEDGRMAKSEKLTIDGKEYTFGDDGAMK